MTTIQMLMARIPFFTVTPFSFQCPKTSKPGCSPGLFRGDWPTPSLVPNPAGCSTRACWHSALLTSFAKSVPKQLLNMSYQLLEHPCARCNQRDSSVGPLNRTPTQSLYAIPVKSQSAKQVNPLAFTKVLHRPANT